MGLLDLPEEVIIMVIKSLDIESQYNLYNTNTYFKNIVGMKGVINTCQFSLNAMATVHCFKLNFFKDIAGHLQELNLSAVNDLNKSMLLPAAKKLKNLKTLNVSFTKITLLDLFAVYDVCPTIKDVSINFWFDKSNHVKILRKVVEKFQNLFEHFVKVHFVGSVMNLFFSKLPLIILQKAKLSELHFTITECPFPVYECYVQLKEMIPFKSFKIFLLNWRAKNQYYRCLNESVLLSMVNLDKCEAIIVSRCTIHLSKVMVTHKFKDFFQEHFGLEAEVITQWTYQELGGNVAIMIWDTESTVFDNSFFKRLASRLKQFYPYHLSSACSDTQVPAKYDWFYTKPNKDEFVRVSEKIEPDFKKRRLANNSEVILNYDLVCRDKHNIAISMIFEDSIFHVKLSRCNEYLRKITFLSLTGSVFLSRDFFKILFSYCTNLVTIDLATTPNFTNSLSRNIPLSKSIKNLRLVAKTIDFRPLLQSLSQCSDIENVHLINEAYSCPYDLLKPQEMLLRCEKLYNLNICLNMTKHMRTKLIHVFNKYKKMFSRHNLNIELNASIGSSTYGYDPYIEVFNLNPIKFV